MSLESYREIIVICRKDFDSLFKKFRFYRAVRHLDALKGSLPFGVVTDDTRPMNLIGGKFWLTEEQFKEHFRVFIH